MFKDIFLLVDRPSFCNQLVAKSFIFLLHTAQHANKADVEENSVLLFALRVGIFFCTKQPAVLRTVVFFPPLIRRQRRKWKFIFFLGDHKTKDRKKKKPGFFFSQSWCQTCKAVFFFSSIPQPFPFSGLKCLRKFSNLLSTCNPKYTQESCGKTPPAEPYSSTFYGLRLASEKDKAKKLVGFSRKGCRLRYWPWPLLFPCSLHL